VGQTSELVLRPCRGTAEWPELVAIWRSAVEGTHEFLTADDIDDIEKRLADEYLGSVEITVATFAGAPVGFSGLADGKLQMLFIGQQHRFRGVGSALLGHAIAKVPDLSLDVNEQNPQAVGFYLHHGFVMVGRSATDADGRPFPILHLRMA
jgi:putative acetyltransferase